MLRTTTRPRTSAVALAALLTATVAGCSAEEGAESATGGGKGGPRPTPPVSWAARRPARGADQRHPAQRLRRRAGREVLRRRPGLHHYRAERQAAPGLRGHAGARRLQRGGRARPAGEQLQP